MHITKRLTIYAVILFSLISLVIAADIFTSKRDLIMDKSISDDIKLSKGLNTVYINTTEIICDGNDCSFWAYSEGLINKQFFFSDEGNKIAELQTIKDTLIKDTLTDYVIATNARKGKINQIGLDKEDLTIVSNK